jgi:hypothetical protein
MVVPAISGVVQPASIMAKAANTPTRIETSLA